MKRRLTAAAILVLAVISILAGCRREGRLIPRKELARIYADMLIADQWLNDNRSLRRQADTTLFYEPIFEHYGYTTADYAYSVRHYMDDPERFSRILKKSSSLLGSRLRKLKAYEAALQRAQDNAPVFVWDPVDVISYYGSGYIPPADTSRVLIIIDSLKYYQHELPGKVRVQPRRSEDSPLPGADLTEPVARQFNRGAEEVLLDNGSDHPAHAGH